MVALKISDNVAHRRGRAGGAVHRATSTRVSTSPSRWRCTCSTELTDKYGTDSRVTNLVDSREIWIIPDLNPDGGEYDIRNGSYAGWRKNRQPNSGSSARRHRPQPQLALPVGLLRRLVRQHVERDLPRPVGRLRARGRDRHQLRAQPRGRRRAADQDQHRLPHVQRAGALAVRLHLQRHRARHDPAGLQHVLDAGPADGRHQRLHAGAGLGPLHHRRLDRRLAVGRPAGSTPTPSRCTRRAAASTASTRPTR